jgi:hypothetical protein
MANLEVVSACASMAYLVSAVVPVDNAQVT